MWKILSCFTLAPLLFYLWLYFWKIFLKKVALGVQYVINNSLPFWNLLTYFQVTGNTVGPRLERGGKPATSKFAPLRESRMYPLRVGISERPSNQNVKSVLSSQYTPNSMNEQPYNIKLPTFLKLNVISKDKNFFPIFFIFFLIRGILTYIETEVLCDKVKMPDVNIFFQTLKIWYYSTLTIIDFDPKSCVTLCYSTQNTHICMCHK